MMSLRWIAVVGVVGCALGAQGQSEEPTAVIDTTAGRMTCRLLTRERPATTARFMGLADGTIAWTSPEGTVVKGRPFYDGTRIDPQAFGIAAGVRARAAAGAGLAVETTPALPFDRAGLLAMSVSEGSAGPSRFVITDHANQEVEGKAVVFGRCDEASARLVGAMRHTLQSTDNHPATPIVVNHVAIVAAGQALPPVARAVVVPEWSGGGLARPSGPEPKGPMAVLETTAGRIACKLFEKESPVAVSTFIGLVEGTKDWTDPTTHVVQHGKRFYDGMALDRVLPDFYIQFGDVTGDISGKVDIGFRFKNERAAALTFDRPGRLAFGNGGPDTNNSELFFAMNPMHVLDGGYPIIGQCDAASVGVLEGIAKLPRNGRNLPLVPVVIERIVIE